MNLEPVASLLPQIEARPNGPASGSACGTTTPNQLRSESSASQSGDHPLRAATDSDRALLTAFLENRSESAFLQLVERHGTLVLGVAARVLHDRQLAEDVFQATFLVLARKAGSIRRKTSLASWLHGVARRIALRLLRQRYRRGEESLTHEPVMDASPFESVGSVWEQQALDEELQQLPDSWREPLILHELEGLSCQATAERLGLTLTALEGRLKRGRKELKHRLLRRGIGLGVVITAVQSAQAAGGLQPSAALVLATVQTSLNGVSGAASGATTTAAEPLTTSQQLSTQELMAMTSLKTSTLAGIAGTLVVAAGIVGGGLDWSRHAGAATGTPYYTVSLLAADGPAGTSPVTRNSFAADPADDAPPADAANAVTAFDAFGFEGSRAEIAVDDAMSAPVATFDRRQMSTREARISEGLAETTSFDFVDVPLQDAVSYLSNSGTGHVVIDVHALSEVGLTPDDPVNLVLPNVPLQSGLNRILRPYDLDYVIRDDVLEITSREAAEALMETRVYELRQLPAEYRPEDIARVIVRTIRPESWGKNPWVYIVPTRRLDGLGRDGYEDMEGSGFDDGSGYGGSSYPGAMYGGDYGEPSGKPIEAGQPHAAIETLPGCLVITHCQRAHREIADLLGQLQRMPSNPGGASSQSRPVEPRANPAVTDPYSPTSSSLSDPGPGVPGPTQLPPTSGLSIPQAPRSMDEDPGVLPSVPGVRTAPDTGAVKLPIGVPADALKVDDRDFINQLHAALLGKEATPAEMVYWLNRLKLNPSRRHLLSEFLNALGPDSVSDVVPPTVPAKPPFSNLNWTIPGSVPGKEPAGEGPIEPPQI